MVTDGHRQPYDLNSSIDNTDYTTSELTARCVSAAAAKCRMSIKLAFLVILELTDNTFTIVMHAVYCE